MKKKKSLLLKTTKETPETRKKRVSSGVKFRAAVFEDKRQKLRDKAVEKTEDEKMSNNSYMLVELHCHTTMSEMDGIVTPTELTMHAEHSGHRAVATSDYAAVHALTEAYKASKGRGIKVIYGAEIYMLKDTQQLYSLHRADLA